MTSVVLNKVGMDLVDIEVEQKGTAQTDIFFQDPVLDYTKEYVLGVSELTVPLGDEPMLTQVPLTEKLLTVRRKGYYGVDAGGARVWRGIRYGEVQRAGGVRAAPVHADAPYYNVAPGQSWTNFNGHYRGLSIQTASQFFDELNKWAVTVNAMMNAQLAAEHGNANLGNNVGAVPVCELKVLVSPSGRVTFRASANFWNLCYFELSQYGMEIFGTGTPIVHYGPNMAVTLGPGVFTVGLNAYDASGKPVIDPNAANFAAHALFVEPGNLGAQPLTRACGYSALRYMESRLRIEVDADLSIPANILVENGQQKMHYNIASFALPNSYKSEIVMNQADDQVQEDVCIISESHVGDTLIKSKKEPVSDWYRLTTASNLQNMRLHIFVVRREFNAVKGKFELVRNRLNMSPSTSWKLTLKFVQLF